MIVETDCIKMSFGFAADVAKQLITLSTAIITLCVALTDKLFSSQVIRSNSTLLLIALGLFVLSILFGLLCMMAITGTLGTPKGAEEHTEVDEDATKATTEQETKDKDPNKGTIYQRNISALMKCQVVIFLVGIVLAVVFLIFAACSQSDVSTQ